MGDSIGDRLRRLDEAKDAWLRQQAADFGQFTDGLEAGAEKAWRTATGDAPRPPQRGMDMPLRGPIPQRRATPSPSPVPGHVYAPVQMPRAGTVRRSGLPEPLLQADTVLRSAANVASFDTADPISAALTALTEPGGLGGWQERYRAALADERARDSYDAIHRPIAQKTGQVLGTGLSFLESGPVKGAALLKRLPGAAKLTAREAAAAMAAAGLTNAGVQAASDLASGRRLSWADEGGAFLGGAISAPPTYVLGPARGSAVTGWVTSAAQDALNGRPVSLDRAGKAAIAGRLFGAAAGGAAKRTANALSPQAKGRLGEAMGAGKSAINGRWREAGPKARDPLPNGKYWVPDGTSEDVRFEDKFGPSARLSPNQRAAQAALGDRFQLYHFLPDDVGGLIGMPAGSIGAAVGPSQDR
ncbi:MAG TPA: hypothetical protein VG939_20860 [Caulobacteraceae bacterium]|nr:hypothetical protein [Caulobacteraceae bacterium]